MSNVARHAVTRGFRVGRRRKPALQSALRHALVVVAVAVAMHTGLAVG